MSNKILMALMSPNIVFYSFLASFLCFLSCHQRSRHCGLETICPISHLDVQGLHPVYMALNCSYVPSVTLFLLGGKKMAAWVVTACSSFQSSVLHGTLLPSKASISGDQPSASGKIINTGSPHHFNYTHRKAQDHTALLQSSSAPFFCDH